MDRQHPAGTGINVSSLFQKDYHVRADKMPAVHIKAWRLRDALSLRRL